MAPKVAAPSLLELPECVYEHIIAMSGDWRARYRAMAKLELAAKACRIDGSKWRHVVLQQLKEIKDVDWETLLFLYPYRMEAYKSQASRCKKYSANLEQLWDLFKATAQDNVGDFVDVLRDYPDALTKIVWDASCDNCDVGSDEYVDGNIISYMFELERDGVTMLRPLYVQPRMFWERYWKDWQMNDEHQKIIDWEYTHCDRLVRPLDNEENRAPCINYDGLVERKIDICTFIEKLANLRKRNTFHPPLKIASHLYSVGALK